MSKNKEDLFAKGLVYEIDGMDDIIIRRHKKEGQKCLKNSFETRG